MNKLIILTLSLLSLYSCEQAANKLNSISTRHAFKTTIPAELITADNFYWKAAAATDTTAIVKAKFETDGTFQFFYNKTIIKGTVEFRRNNAGKNILITHATSSINDRKKQPGKEELTNTYLWERISFPGIPSEDFLLLVNLEAYPEASMGSINKNRVAKFHVRQ
ncbi:MAG: hypothetical protein IPP72_21775 [Chitinophagaceae bacterium]|nr:hypothetical protein [Chitinophagaceae bacterium]